MSLGKEPLDDDILDTVSGGTELNNPNECSSWVWDTMGSTENSCATCKKSGKPLCPFGK